MTATDHPLLDNEAALGDALAALRERLLPQGAGPAHPADAAQRLDAVPTLQVLQQRLGLSDFERQVLLLCVGAALDTRMAALCAGAVGDPACAYPSYALALTRFDAPAWEALSPHRPLRWWRLIEVHGGGAKPLAMCALRADDRIVDFVKGLNELDERIAQALLPLPPDGGQALPSSQQSAADLAHDFIVQRQPDDAAPTLLLTGIDSGSKHLVAVRVAARLGLRLARIGPASLPAPGADLDAWCRLWQRECRLLPLALYIDASDLPGGDSADHGSAQLARLLDRLQSLCFVDCRDAAALGTGVRDGVQVLAVDRPTTAEQTAAWSAQLGADQAALATRLAGQFNLNLPQIRVLVRDARSAADNASHTAADSGGAAMPGPDAAPNAPADAAPDAGMAARLWLACRRGTQPRMDKLAQRIVAKASWDDIVLPDEALALLQQLVAQLEQRRKVYGEWGFERRTSRGLGLAALFHGESGTGKTMAAEVIASALRLDLYRIDLSAVVSKYIGETEKNLQRVFDAAEDGGGILFFDEADALFGKRSEVRDSHDRYANIETNYLLQRIEAFRGLAILATNQKGALDTAFMRRLRFVVPFNFPGTRERVLMWQKAFPPQTPTEGLDTARLARLDCTGGSIHSIALNAAFLAAHQSCKVTMSHVLSAARSEMLKLGRPVVEADFRHAVQGLAA